MQKNGKSKNIIGELRLQLEIDQENLERIFRRIDNAKSELYACYRELEEIGVLRIVSEAEE